MTVATLTKTVGSGGDYSTLQSWEDDAPANLTTSERWNANTFVGTFQHGEPVTGTGITGGKFLATDQASFIAFGTTTGASAGVVTGSTSGAVCTISTRSDLGIIWQGKTKNSTDLFGSSGSTTLTVSGSTTSSSAYKELTAGAGTSFQDSTITALKYDASKGASIQGGGGYVTAVVISENNFHLSRLQITNLSANSHNSALDVQNSGYVIDAVIIDGSQATTSGVPGVFKLSADGTASNFVAINRASSAAHSATMRCDTGSAINLVNGTVVAPSDVANKPSTGILGSYTTINLKNVAVFGASAPITVGGTVTANKTTCYTDNTATGWTTVAFDTSTGSGFQGTTLAALDLRLKSTSGLIDVGTSYVAPPPTADIQGTARPSGGGWDVGAWEYVSSGITGTASVTNANDTSSASGTQTNTGTLTKTNVNDSVAASGRQTNTGTLARTNANDTLAASGTAGGGYTGTSSTTNANDNAAASGIQTNTGTLTRANANDTLAAQGYLTTTGTLAVTNAYDTAVASGTSGTVAPPSGGQSGSGGGHRESFRKRELRKEIEALIDAGFEEPNPVQVAVVEKALAAVTEPTDVYEVIEELQSRPLRKRVLMFEETLKAHAKALDDEEAAAVSALLLD